MRDKEATSHDDFFDSFIFSFLALTGSPVSYYWSKCKRIGKKPKFPVAASMLMAVMLLGTAAVSNITPGSVFAYRNNQATSEANDCGNGDEPFNILCQNLVSQIQGDGNAVNLIGSQTGGREIPGGSGVPTIQVRMTVLCPTDFVCPGPRDFLNALSITTVPQSVLERGSVMDLNPEQAVQDIFFLDATELQFSIRIDPSLLPPAPPGLRLQLDTQTYSGTVNPEQSSTCIFSSEYVPVQPPQG